MHCKANDEEEQVLLDIKYECIEENWKLAELNVTKIL